MTRAADLPIRPGAPTRAPAAKPGPVPNVLGRVLSVPYAAAVAYRNRRFNARKGVIHFDRTVVSVGNLSVGGTGKTPMVAWLARAVFDAGHFPCIAMRGYRAAPGGESDEAATYARALPHVPVVAQPNRMTGLVDLFATPAGEKIDCILLDDGFQHRQIAREIDLVLIDATRSPFEDRLLPAGWLREPAKNLARATGVIITHAESADAATLSRLRAAVEHAGSRVLAVCRHDWSSLTITDDSGDRDEPPAWLARRKVLAVCAIGNPAPFIRAAEQAVGGPLAGSIVLRDHDPYKPATIAQILAQARESRAELILTTDKDWSKLRAHTWPLPIARPHLQLRFDSGEQQLRDLVIDAVIRGPEPLPDEEDLVDDEPASDPGQPPEEPVR